MLLRTSVAAYFVLDPSEMLDIEKAVMAATLSVSNFHFWRTTDYFSSQSNPLLRTWSLGVEEHSSIARINVQIRDSIAVDLRDVLCARHDPSSLAPILLVQCVINRIMYEARLIL